MRTSIALSIALALGSLSQFACIGAPAEAAGEVAGAEEADTLSAADCPSSVPDTLQPDADQKLTFSFVGVGFQIYVCTATPTGFAWILRQPDALLLSKGGEVEGTHYLGPTWEANDGSKIVGAVHGAPVPSPDPAAIPWLLLDVISHGGPKGRFSRVSTIQRLNTSGGRAPATGCDAAHESAEASVPYTAGYFFYTTHEHGRNKQCGD